MFLNDTLFRRHIGGDYGVFFEISDEDSAGDPKYYGYLSSGGVWIIMEWNAGLGTYRYCSGQGLYTANWTARVGLTYTYFNLM